MSYSLNSLKGLYKGLYKGSTTGLTEGDTRSLDYSSYQSNNLPDDLFRHTSSIQHIKGLGFS